MPCPQICICWTPLKIPEKYSRKDHIVTVFISLKIRFQHRILMGHSLYLAWTHMKWLPWVLVVPFFCTLLIWNQPIFLCLVFSHPCKLYSEMPLNYEIWNYVTWVFRVKVWTLDAFDCLSNCCSRVLKSQDIGQSRERDLFIVTASGRRATKASDLQVHLQDFDVRLGFSWRTIAAQSCLVKVPSSPPLMHLCLCPCLSCGVVVSCLSCVKSLPGARVPALAGDRLQPFSSPSIWFPGVIQLLGDHYVHSFDSQSKKGEDQLCLFGISSVLLGWSQSPCALTQSLLK